ncbi:leucyl/phenylalanyl-tRNA--protein transferase [Oscillatoria sp. FACHB-1406]|uniref:leucyl/phenylalanyl-tRNA--protein transferase n=1 Tax=Oscillatoria sp. FACHB-1406 TaxID=2692846 RepID=UPI001686F8CD|nr:leucyl/phenylalanyl-tRNA--protein transferase [Oscillatoria sp. FACHB-1406]MBD2577824.1 leucyl/phenylalanyl-tRNA--protein transferase [Oscillatoria sp. FACHB-1406]
MAFDVAEIVEGYARGYFLMSNERGELGWYSSRQRAIIPLDHHFRYPKSLQRILNQNRFSVAIDRAFEAVCEGCANRKTTWISPELQLIYRELHRAGLAHSFETWQGDELAGGILGLTLRGAFIGESMFFRIPDGSKVAMVKLVEHLRSHNFILFDAQLQNPHLERFGSMIIGDRDYQSLLQQALLANCTFV